MQALVQLAGDMTDVINMSVKRIKSRLNREVYCMANDEKLFPIILIAGNQDHCGQ
jgi:hypothetical protein